MEDEEDPVITILRSRQHRKFAATSNDKLEGLAHSRGLDSNLEGILKALDNGNLACARHTVLSAKQSLSGLQQYLSTTIEPVYYNAHRPSHGTVIAKALAIPEILEAILEKLEVVDIMRCYGVNRTFRDTIEASTNLQTCLFLQPAPSGTALERPFDFEDFSCKLGEAWTTDPTKFRASISARGKELALPAIGDRWRRMLVRQPPIYEMSYSIGCYPEGFIESFMNRTDNSHQNIRSKNGLTVHDLYEAAKALFELHRFCESAIGLERKTVHFAELEKKSTSDI